MIGVMMDFDNIIKWDSFGVNMETNGIELYSIFGPLS